MDRDRRPAESAVTAGRAVTAAGTGSGRATGRASADHIGFLRAEIGLSLKYGLKPAATASTSATGYRGGRPLLVATTARAAGPDQNDLRDLSPGRSRPIAVAGREDLNVGERE